jgi:hypothetical protein
MMTVLENTANGASQPLIPNIEVTPNRVVTGQEITLTVQVQVVQESNISASRPIANGEGGASLINGTSSMLVNAGDMGTLMWSFNATQAGTIHFSLQLSVTNVADGQVTLSESLTSANVNVSHSTDYLMIGVAIISVYILFSAHHAFNAPSKPHRKIPNIWEVLIALCALVAGWITGALGFLAWRYWSWNPVLILGGYSAILFFIGLYGCWLSKQVVRPFSWVSERVVQKELESKMTELGGLFIVLFGLFGLFLTWGAYFEAVILLAVGIMGIGKEYIEMEIEKK